MKLTANGTSLQYILDMFVGAVCAIADKIAIKICGNGGCGTFPQHKLLAVPSEIIPRKMI